MVTSEEVARLAGVSRATVSRALNGSARVRKEARERVHAAIATLGYEPDLVAQSLVRQRSSVIALSLFPGDNGLTISRLGETDNYFYLDVLKNIEREVIARGYDLLIAMIEGGGDVSPLTIPMQIVVRRSTGPAPEEFY